MDGDGILGTDEFFALVFCRCAAAGGEAVLLWGAGKRQVDVDLRHGHRRRVLQPPSTSRLERDSEGQKREHYHSYR